MDLTTELATGFPVSRYRALRDGLGHPVADVAAWAEVVAAVRRRIDERFLQPITTLTNTTGTEGIVPGFAILALDCLLIDTIQSFREGRETTGKNSAARSFGSFLKRARFSCFSSNDRSAFYHYVRNGLLHNGETRGDWKVRTDTSEMLTRVAGTNERVLNRKLFHEAIVEEVVDYFHDLAAGAPLARARFLQRMDALSGVPPTPEVPVGPTDEMYFAYGSNLSEREMLAKAPNARAEGLAFLPGYRLVFTKHSMMRRCDAASIERSACSMVWGLLYSIPSRDAVGLAKREGGYARREVAVWRSAEPPDDDPQRVDAYTFVGKVPCLRGCGPAPEYVRLIVDGASARGLPEEYVASIESHVAI